MGPTLAPSIWVIYYGILGITIVMGVMTLVKGTIKRFYSFGLIVAVPLFIVNNLLGCISRVGMNEWQYWKKCIATGEAWAWGSLVLFAYMVFYWIALFAAWRKKNQHPKIAL